MNRRPKWNIFDDYWYNYRKSLSFKGDLWISIIESELFESFTVYSDSMKNRQKSSKIHRTTLLFSSQQHCNGNIFKFNKWLQCCFCFWCVQVDDDDENHDDDSLVVCLFILDYVFVVCMLYAIILTFIVYLFVHLSFCRVLFYFEELFTF